jgi:hypothetical protein
VRPNARIPEEVDLQATFTFLESSTGAAGVRAVRPGLKVRGLLGRRIYVLRCVCRRTEHSVRCLGICAVLKKVSNNIMVQSFRCNHKGRGAIFYCYVHACTEFVNMASRQIEVSRLCCDV